MIIILKNIPADTGNKKIEDFIRPVIKGSLLSKSGRIESISNLVQKNIKTNKIEHHGLVRITPDSVAERAIKKLNRKRVNGRYINVHEYQIRLWQNDHRISRGQIENFTNKRQSDRRCRNVSGLE